MKISYQQSLESHLSIFTNKLSHQVIYTVYNLLHNLLTKPILYMYIKRQNAIACSVQPSDNMHSSLPHLTLTALDAIRTAEEQVALLAHERVVHKMSNNRAVTVARELKELHKVLALYGY